MLYDAVSVISDGDWRGFVNVASPEITIHRFKNESNDKKMLQGLDELPDFLHSYFTF